MFLEKRPPYHKLPRQRLGARQVTVGLNPHPAEGFPAPFGDALFDAFKKLRVVLLHIIVKLRLTLRKGVLRELFHEPQDGVKGATGLAAGLAERPEPGDVNVCVPGGGDRHVGGGTGGNDPGLEEFQCTRHAVVKLVGQLEGLELLERVV